MDDFLPRARSDAHGQLAMMLASNSYDGFDWLHVVQHVKKCLFFFERDSVGIFFDALLVEQKLHNMDGRLPSQRVKPVFV